MNTFSQRIDEYYIALIIISIIGFALLILFAIYFLYIPFIRINSILDDVFDIGNEVINIATGLESQTSLTNAQIQSLYIGFCNLNKNIGEGKVTIKIKTPIPFINTVTLTKALTWEDTFDDFCKIILDK